MDVYVASTAKMRGQAFVSYEDVLSASEALRNLQNTVFLEKLIHVQYAKSPSERVARMDGVLKKTKRKARMRSRKDESQPADQRCEQEVAENPDDSAG